jgi:LysR family transcriptional regulator of gallate degradation
MINTRHLRAFVAVAQTGSVSQAASLVHRAQSAVTRAIKELEKGVGVPLFERRPRGMLLTEFGRVLLNRSQNAQFEMDAARDAFAELARGRRWNAQAPVFLLGLSRQRLLVFAELIRQRHMGAVADTFAISQPAVSQALREIEQGVGLQLVERTASGIVPNTLGSLLSIHLRRSLAEIAKAEEEIASLLHGVIGHVTVGTLSLARNRILPRAIIRLGRDHPGITLTTIEGTFEYLATLVRSSDLDFMIGGLREPEHMVGLTAQPVSEDRIALIARNGHPLMQAGGVDRARLAEARWVLPLPGTWTRSSLETALGTLGLPPPRVVVETADISITRSLVMESDLITAASPDLFRHELDDGSLIAIPADLPSPPREVGIIQRMGAAPTTAAQLLMSEIVSGARYRA